MKILLLAATIITLLPNKTEPTWNRDIKDGSYVISNPLKLPVKVWAWCGGDWAEVGIDVPAQSNRHVIFRKPNGEPAVCMMDNWETTK
jgi:hypothetical protein